MQYTLEEEAMDRPSMGYAIYIRGRGDEEAIERPLEAIRRYVI